MKQAYWTLGKKVSEAFRWHATRPEEGFINSSEEYKEAPVQQQVSLKIPNKTSTTTTDRHSKGGGTKCDDNNCSDDHKSCQFRTFELRTNNNNSVDTNFNISNIINTRSLENDHLEQADIEALKHLEEHLRARENHHNKSAQNQDTQVEAMKPNSKPLANKEEVDVNLSFCGCGFLGCYHVGVTSCFHEYAPQLSQHKISGSSAGALVATAHICGNLSLAYCTTDILSVAIEARSRTLGPFHPSFDIQASVREALERNLPEDAYLKANGRLHVSLTRVEDGENVIVNKFASNEDLIQVLLCSCFIPFWSGIKLPKFRGVAYIDGGFSNNLLKLDDKTVTISPFSGEADICPQDDTYNLLTIDIANTSFSLSPCNLYRISQALLPPAPEVLGELFEQGFADGIRFLQRMNLISCTRCLEFRSSLLVTTTTNDGDLEDVISISQSNESLSEVCGSLRNEVFTNETSSMQRIILEQHEQKIEILIDPQKGSLASNNETHPLNYIRKLNDASSSLSLCHETADETRNKDGCGDCVLIQQKALYGAMPKQFSDRIREACESVNKSLYNWIYSHRPIKYFSYLLVPYYLPIDVSLALIYNCWKGFPTVRTEVIDCICQVIQFVISILKSTQTRLTTSILMGSVSTWEEADCIAFEKELLKRQSDGTQVLHHHYHHHHVHHPHNHHGTRFQNQLHPQAPANHCHQQ